MQTPFSPLSFGESFMKIRSAVPENGCLVFFVADGKSRKKQKKTKRTSVKHTHPPHRRLRKYTPVQRLQPDDSFVYFIAV